jgi:hypothetical protein
MVRKAIGSGERRLTAQALKVKLPRGFAAQGIPRLPRHGLGASWTAHDLQSQRSFILTSRQRSTQPGKVPKLSERRAFNPTDAGFSLNADEDTLREIEEIQDEAVRAAQETRKFAWR